MTADEQPTVVRLIGGTKRFGATTAVDHLDLTIRPGEVLALMGENGSGKSTACKLIAGVHAPDEGHVEVDGRQVELRHPSDAMALGIRMVYQEFSLIDSMTVGQNMQLGRERRFFTNQQVERSAQAALAALGFQIEPTVLVGALGSAQKQMVEIAKAVSSGARFLLFDEPTATLTPEEKRQLFHIMERLRAGGLGIVLVTHVLEEAIENADRITILRDGIHQVTAAAADLDRTEIVRQMVGRDVPYQPRRAERPPSGDPLLVVRSITAKPAVHGMSFSVRRGEVVAVAGLVGSGRTESAHVVAGITKRDRIDGGRIELAGRSLRSRAPRHAVQRGIAYVTEDRKADGYFETMSPAENIYLGWLARRGGWFSSRRRQAELMRANVETFDIRGNLDGTVKDLSGGNQQKVVIAKALAQDPDVVFFDEPTRGVDVGAIAAIHQVIRQVADSGRAVVVISSYLPEVLAVSDRVLVARAGKIVAEFDPDRATEEEILFAAVH